MTLATSTRYVRYDPVTATDSFNVPFPLFGNGDLQVFVDGVQTTDFSVTSTFVGGRAEDAVIVLGTPVTGLSVEVYGARSPRRDDEYLPGSPNLADNLQRDIEALTAVQQEQVRDIQNARAAQQSADAAIAAADRAALYAQTNQQLQDIGGAAPTAGHVLVGDGSTFQSSELSGLIGGGAVGKQVFNSETAAPARTALELGAAALLGVNNGADWAQNGGLLADRDAIDARISQRVGGLQITAGVNFEGRGGVTINQVHGISSVVRNAAGRYTLNFATPRANTNYLWFVQIANAGEPAGAGFGYDTVKNGSVIKTVSSLRFGVGYAANALTYDADDVSVIIVEAI